MIYYANRDTREFVLDSQGQLAETTDKKCDEIGKNLLKEGDSLEKAIACYGTDYNPGHAGEYKYEENT